jgi:hypothetical protein
VERWSGGAVERWSGGVVEWWSGGVVEWWSGGVVEWWSGGVVRQAVALPRGKRQPPVSKASRLTSPALVPATERRGGYGGIIYHRDTEFRKF